MIPSTDKYLEKTAYDAIVPTVVAHAPHKNASSIDELSLENTFATLTSSTYSATPSGNSTSEIVP